VITFSNACRILSSFKEDYLGEKHFKVHMNNLNNRKRKSIFREDNLLMSVRAFGEMSADDQFRKEIVIECCARHARAGYTSDMMAQIESLNDEINFDINHCDINPDISNHDLSVSVLDLNRNKNF